MYMPNFGRSFDSAVPTVVCQACNTGVARLTVDSRAPLSRRPGFVPYASCMLFASALHSIQCKLTGTATCPPTEARRHLHTCTAEEPLGEQPTIRAAAAP